MTSILMGVIGIALLVVGAAAVRLQWRVGPIGFAIAAICVAFAYDALIVAFGRVIGYGDLLHALSVPRFWLLAIAFPLLIPVTGTLMARLGVQQARTRNFVLGGAALVIMLILIGVIVDGVRLELEPKNAGDALRYINGAADGVQLPTIITILGVIVLAVAAARYARFPWLVIPALLLFATAATAPKVLWVGALGELIIMAALVFTMKTVGDREMALATTGEGT